jgi:hypothetical protein
MTRAASVPAETDPLCEGCGYVLSGLPGDGRCPECGKPLEESAATLRREPDWEQPDASGSASASALRRFSRTTAACIFRPTAFLPLPQHQPRAQPFAAVRAPPLDDRGGVIRTRRLETLPVDNATRRPG